MERQNTMTVYAGRHRKTSASEHSIHRISTTSAFAGIVGGDTLYVSLTDAATGNMLGINFESRAIESRAIESLRRVLDKVAA